ncbi:ABC 3 transport family protein [Orientia chuto str. Dubai]|uniref:High-affinity zinc uptake system membrane protein ZnuB n=1 Tax=Orientia chuto str. Dubai TaxID=1359168 RepID=A0A0F3MLD4_9RICK|nr:metal ABC transporter permease [Candidatus Orientia mediorientalis]KJV56272.1 ABC 3 transport family protein [Orientia chuto str. Dubai]
MTTLIINLIIATVLISILLASLGCVILWQRYTSFSDGLVHSCVLAGSIVTIFNLPTLISAFSVALIYSGAILFFDNKNYNKSTIVFIVSNGMLALSAILATIVPGAPTISSLLFGGEFLLINSSDLIILFILLLIVGVLIYKNFKTIILMSLNKELAMITLERSPKIVEMIFLLILSTVIIITVKIFGSLFLTAWLVIPAATARIISNSAAKMIVYSNLISLVFNLTGVGVSLCFDTPTAATMVFINFLAFTFFFIVFKLLRYKY